MHIGNIELKNKVIMAPMAGISNPSYMKICEEMGCAYAVTELISSEAIIRNNKKTLDMLNGIDTLKMPVAVQIFGSSEDVMAKAAKIITDLHKNVLIDINMGCPVPKVAVKANSGSYLLKYPDKVYSIVSSVVKAVDCPVTVKIRSGWDNEHINAVEIAKKIEKAGASAVCIHPRTRSQGYSGLSDWSIIKNVKKSVSIPVIGNGDIKTCYDADLMIKETGCDFIMIGRGLLGNPWLIRETVAFLNDKTIIEKPSYKEKIEMCIKHLDYLLLFKSEKEAVLEIRTHVSWYLKGINGGKEIKETIFRTKNVDEIKKILLDFEKMC